MSKRKLLFLLLVNMHFVVKAQTAIGVESGISSSYLNTNISNRVSTSIANNIGYTINIPFQFKINHHLYIETLPGIIQKNYFINRTDSLSGIYQKFRNTYLQIPVSAKFVYGKRLEVFADVGVYAGYWLTQRTLGNTFNILGVNDNNTIQQVNYNQKVQFNPQTDNRIEVGWIIGGGTQYHLNKKYMLIAAIRYYQSLTDQQKEYMINQVPQYNQTFTFSIGCMEAFK